MNWTSASGNDAGHKREDCSSVPKIEDRTGYRKYEWSFYVQLGGSNANIVLHTYIFKIKQDQMRMPSRITLYSFRFFFSPPILTRSLPIAAANG